MVVFDALILRLPTGCGLDSLAAAGKSAVVGAGPVAPGCASKGKLPLGAAGLQRTDGGLLVPGVIILASYGGMIAVYDCTFVFLSRMQ